MSAVELTPPEAARWAARAGLVLPAERHAAVAAVADHIHGVVAVLRELDFEDVPPAAAYHAAYRAGEELHDAAV
ncbi:hypothetical protein PUR71_29615 [Streptomyces sp. SP17BM10]|uniref:hypothetical protein n=1 Tax=Streptomyces sp. SP17BM10 TaxID=3002530 RepID=UPI002E7A2102|nr:hypothetical protein [Streptomyces sp. SP17BM10]MEE1787031.1 hypothetical protein [Streptomyces sp. SP17BM10]